MKEQISMKPPTTQQLEVLTILKNYPDGLEILDIKPMLSPLFSENDKKYLQTTIFTPLRFKGLITSIVKTAICDITRADNPNFKKTMKYEYYLHKITADGIEYLNNLTSECSCDIMLV